MHKLLFKLSLIVLLFLVFTPFLSADVYVPTSTNVIFTYDGESYDKDVEYTVTCYGTPFVHDGMTDEEKADTESVIEKTYSYSASCPASDCKIFENYYIRGGIDYCDLKGESADGVFEIKKFAEAPISNCDRANEQIVMYDGDNNYKSTPEFDECKEDGGSLDDCRKHLAVIDDSEIQKDDKGYPLEEACKITFDIPAGTFDSEADVGEKPNNAILILLGVFVILLIVGLSKKK